jgi:aminomethyltransferase
MGAFGGWEMPLSYEGTLVEHRAVRERLGAFDVSHMGQIEVSGDGAADFLQSVLTNDVAALGEGDGQYTLMLTESGGVIDDLIAYSRPGHYLLVVNASNAAACLDWLRSRAAGGVAVRDRSDGIAMIALQGAEWAEALATLGAGDVAAELDYFEAGRRDVAGLAVLVARTGYTGEPGVELMCAWDDAPALWESLMGLERPPMPAGLVARDTLRLEMGYPLHGNELSLERTPLEAGLGWACALETDFVGADELRARAERGLSEKLTMFRLTERGIPRAGQTVLHGGEPVGTVTSGSLSPSLDIGIGMAYVPPELAEPDTEIAIDVRGALKAARTAKRPLVDTSPKKG